VRVRYLNLKSLQDMILCCIKCLLFFPEYIKETFSYLFNSNLDRKTVHEPPLTVFCHHSETASIFIGCNSIPKQDSDDKNSQVDTVSSQKAVMYVARYAPLKLSSPLHELPQNYGQRIPKFDNTGKITARQHVSRVIDFMDLEEVDYEDVKLRLFSQSLAGEVRRWYKGLAAGSIPSFQQFEYVFIDRWEVKINPFQIMDEYQNLKRQPDETVQGFSTRFNRVYNSIPLDIKPPPWFGYAQFFRWF
jgi:hypothetical protein